MYRSDPIEGMHRFEIKATEKRHVAPVKEECRVDVHASRDAVGCPAHAQNKLEWAPHHTTLPFDLLFPPLTQLPFHSPHSPSSTRLPKLEGLHFDPISSVLFRSFSVLP